MSLYGGTIIAEIVCVEYVCVCVRAQYLAIVNINSGTTPSRPHVLMPTFSVTCSRCSFLPMIPVVVVIVVVFDSTTDLLLLLPWNAQ